MTKSTARLRIASGCAVLLAILVLLLYCNPRTQVSSEKGATAAKGAGNPLSSLQERSQVNVLNTHNPQALAELETMREANRRLEAENQFLIRQLEEARELAQKAQLAAVKKSRALQQTNAKLNEVLEPMRTDSYSSTLQTEVDADHTVVTGGFQVADGRVEYTLTTPTVLVDELGRNVILLEHQRLAIPPDLVERLGMKSLASSANNTLQHGETWRPEQTRDFISKISASQGADESGGVDQLAAPRISVLDGQEAEVQIGDYRAKFKATISKDGHGVRLEMRTSQPAP